MTRIVFTYGPIAGLISIGLIVLGITLSGGHGDGSQTFGYLTMLVALTLIFIGVKRHRDVNKGGVIRFFPALLCGIAIAAVAGVFYALGWEVYVSLAGDAYMDEYIAGMIEAKRSAGVSGAELEKLIADMNAFKESYANPIFRILITFTEIFPVGVVVAIVSAAILTNPRAFPAKAG